MGQAPSRDGHLAGSGWADLSNTIVSGATKSRMCVVGFAELGHMATTGMKEDNFKGLKQLIGRLLKL